MKDYAFPQHLVRGVVRPRDEHEDDHEPILGLGRGACCESCAQGGPCSGCEEPKSIPGSTSFPVGFGQTNAPITTTSVPVAMVSSWVLPVGIALVAAAAGFGLAYAVRNRT